VSFYSFLCQFVVCFCVSVERISAGRDSHSLFLSLFALWVFLLPSFVRSFAFIRSPRLCLHFAASSPVLFIVGVGVVLFAPLESLISAFSVSSREY
jgi:hypothetical protein